MVRAAGRSPSGRCAAQLLTDEAFALAVAHFRRLGRFDALGYWYAAIVTTLIPWNVATLAGVTIGGAIVDPTPVRDRRHLPGRDGRAGRRPDHRPARARGGASRARRSASSSSLAVSPTVGVIAGGVLGPFVGLLVPPARRRAAPIGSEASAAVRVPTDPEPLRRRGRQAA